MARSRGRIGGNSNVTPRLKTSGFPRPKILRPRDPMTKTTLQPGRAMREGSQKIGIGKNVFTQMGRPVIRARVSVRRLFVKDPYNLNSVSGIGATGATQATFSDVADQFTNNANPQFHPENAPGAVRTVRVGQAQPGTKNRGKIFRPNRQTLFSGKTLRRR